MMRLPMTVFSGGFGIMQLGTLLRLSMTLSGDSSGPLSIFERLPERLYPAIHSSHSPTVLG